MGRRSSGRSGQRDQFSSIANDLVADLIFDQEDRRYLAGPEPTAWNSYTRPAIGVTFDSTRVVAPPRSSYNLGGFAFRDPSLVSICARRARRREVLHALRRVRGGSGGRRRRRNWYSSISCR